MPRDEVSAPAGWPRRVPWWALLAGGTVLHFLIWGLGMSAAWDALPSLLGSVLFDGVRLAVPALVGAGWYLLLRRGLGAVPALLLAVALAAIQVVAMTAAALLIFFPKI